MPLTNEAIRSRAFLQSMYDDKYFPKHLVDKGKQILVRLCERIEAAARESIGEEFWFIAKAYGFDDADQEELIAPRKW
jgi:hypothetical protein